MLIGKAIASYLIIYTCTHKLKEKSKCINMHFKLWDSLKDLLEDFPHLGYYDLTKKISSKWYVCVDIFCGSVLLLLGKH